MKKSQLFPVVLFLFLIAACSGGKEIQSYEPGCDQIVVNVNAGVVNGIDAKASAKEIKAQFPCATEGSDENCGSWIGSESRNFYFYPEKDFIEIKFPFQGSDNPPAMTTSRDRLIESFGKPARSEKDGKHEKLFFEMDYGTLIVMLQGGKSKDFIMHSADPEEVSLCR